MRRRVDERLLIGMKVVECTGVLEITAHASDKAQDAAEHQYEAQ
jgi:hypothetical protein